MDQKLDTNEYVISKDSQGNEHSLHLYQRLMPYVMANTHENLLGSPIGFQQFKNPNIDSTDVSGHSQLEQITQNYGQSMPYSFDYQRQYSNPLVPPQVANQAMNFPVQPLIQQQQQQQQQQQLHQPQPQPQPQAPMHFQHQYPSQNQVRAPIPTTGVILRNTATNDIPIPTKSPANISRARTPVENVSQETPGSASSSRKRARKSDLANPGDEGDTELKQLAFKASSRPLSELALSLKSVENNVSQREGKGSVSEETKKERQRQVFGMVWLLGSCEASPTAVVPRKRIYARYVQICAEYGLHPLSPASFGKLVRLLFPNLTTRRLGMRGQSKYHYCGVRLVSDQNVQENSPSSTTSSVVGMNSPKSPHAPHTPSFTGSPYVASTVSTPTSTLVLSEQLQASSLKYVPNIFNLIDYSLSKENMNSPINLPSIYPFLTLDVDYDIADTLYSLYKVHCTTIFEHLRYMQVRKLFASFSSFNSILTSPVFKLYISDSILEWVRKCDNVMYKSMIKMLSKLHLQNISDEILRQLLQISNQYVEQLSTSLQSKVPKTFMLMKLKGAKEFTSLLSRIIKVIESGRSALRILSNPSETLLMLEDWMKLNINEIIAREVPCAKENIDLLSRIFNNEFLDLFSKFARASETSDNASNNNKLIELASFILELPSKFSKANPRLFLLVSSNLLTTCLREISLTGGRGFGNWWIVRCWFDEYLNWCFELGGFLYDDFQSIDISDLDLTRTGFQRMRSISIDTYTNDLLMSFESIGNQNILVKDEETF